MKTVQFTMQERWAVSRHLVQKNKKKYNRKRDKQENRGAGKSPLFYFKLGSPILNSYIPVFKRY